MLGDQVPEFEAVILAGGQAARMHGADKPALEVGSVPLLVLVARAAASAGARRVIVVGPERAGAVGRGLAAVGAALDRGLVTVRESPPGGGPVPAVRRGIEEASASWLAVLAADLPFLTGPWLAALLSLGESSGRAGAVLADDDRRPQWLAGCWHRAELSAALHEYAGHSLGGLLGPLQPVLLDPAQLDTELPGAVPQPWLDCDDPGQLAAARAAYLNGES
jgi:molybdopterin-guanine dinucleotide biosynthesis protein A